MSEITAHIDENQNNSIIGVQGTLGTADVGGTSPTLPISVDPTTGAAYVYNLGPAGSVSLGNITGGTIDYIGNIGTMPAISVGNPTGGTTDLLKDGTVAIKGTVPISGSLAVTPQTNGSILGTVIGTTTPITLTLNNGDSAAAIQVSGTWSGQLNFESSVDGTNWFTHMVTSGVVVGGITNAVTGNGIFETSIGGLTAIRTNPISWVSGTAYITIKSSTGPHAIELDSSLPSGVNSIGNIGTVGTISNLNGGSIIVTNGTLASSGTTTGVGVIGNLNAGTLSILTNGSIVVTGGTIKAGTINAGTINAGTINTLGTLAILTNGTLSNSGTTTGVGIVGNINGGSIVVTAGTIASSGTVTGVGVVGNLNGGTLGILTNGTVATNILPLGGVVKTTAVVCGTAATALPASTLSSRKSLIGYNIGTIPCYIGDSTVSVTSGIPIGTSSYSPAIDLGTTILYGVASAASGGTLVVLEVS